MEKEELHEKVGQTFDISLSENAASTGYQWAVGHMPDNVDFLNTEYTPPEEHSPGKSGTRVFTFAAMAPGKGTLKLDYVRLFELPKIAESKDFPVVVEA